MTGKVTAISGKAAFDKLLADSGDKLIVVDFYADWCGPCKMIGPKIEVIAAQNPDVIFIKVNVDIESEISEACEISVMPTFHFYKNGEKKKSIEGASEDKVKDAISSCR